MAAYTTTQEIKFGHRVDERGFAVLLEDDQSLLEIELKIKDGKYALVDWFDAGSCGDGGKYKKLFTRGLTLRFTVTGNLCYFIDESRLT